MKSQQRVTAYGNFEAATVTRLIQPLVDEKQLTLIGSSILRKRNQLRLWFSDKTGLAIALNRDARGSMVARATTLKIDENITCISNGDDENGVERILFGCDDGYVYEMEKGFSFNGDAIEEFLRTNYNNPLGDTRREFKVFGVTWNIKSQANFSIQIAHDMSYSSSDQAPAEAKTSTQDLSALGGGGFYDDSNYDEFYYDAEVVTQAAVPLGDTGNNISFTIYNSSAITKSYELEGFTLDYSPRKLKRAY